MFWMEKYRLPDAPPALDQMVEFSDAQYDAATRLINDLSAGLVDTAVILSQADDIVCAAGLQADESIHDLAAQARAIWMKQPDMLAREVIQFKMVTIESASVILITVHILGGLTLTVGWPPELSLTMVRGEIISIKQQLLHLFEDK